MPRKIRPSWPACPTHGLFDSERRSASYFQVAYQTLECYLHRHHGLYSGPNVLHRDEQRRTSPITTAGSSPNVDGAHLSLRPTLTLGVNRHDWYGMNTETAEELSC